MNEIEEIKARIDIVDFIGRYVTLQKAGRAYKALCPFHNERTPSFIVSPDRQSWHCFGACGTGGDVISFVMRREGMEFGDALRLLAERAGVTLSPKGARAEEDAHQGRLYAANEAAAQFFHGLLVEGEAGRQARQYLEGRGVDSLTAEMFLLGYSPPAWEALREHLRERGFSDEEMLAAGLVVQGERGLHDRFRGRLMFPIRDTKGRVIGFGGRVLDGGAWAGAGPAGPKYLNTAQTPIFDKGAVLYALDRARDAIRREGRAVIVEGYMDAIAAHQSGFDNVVASMGTALTERQVRLLKRLTAEVVLALDADAAGSEAAVRGHDVVRAALEEEGAVPVVNWRGLVGYQSVTAVELRVAVLPEGRDPDEVIRESPDRWQELVQSAKPVLEYRLEAAAAAQDLSDPRGRSRLVQEYLPLLTAVADPVVRAHYIQRLSRLALVSESELAAVLGRGKRARSGAPVLREPAAYERHGDAREEFLLGLLLQHPQLREEGLAVSEDLFWGNENRQLLSAWKQHEGIEAVKEALPLELHPYLERLSQRRLPSFDMKEARAALVDCRERLERRRLEAEKQALDALLADREEELGPAALVQAISAEVEDERVREAVRLQMRDLELGLRLHAKERSSGGDPVEARADD